MFAECACCKQAMCNEQTVQKGKPLETKIKIWSKVNDILSKVSLLLLRHILAYTHNSYWNYNRRKYFGGGIIANI